MRAVDATLDRLWRKGVATRPPLTPDSLLRAAPGAAAASNRCGWRGRLDLLCADLNGHARLTPLGRTLAHGQLVAALRHRIRAEALWARAPEILDRPVPAPVIIVGQMRSGSTRLQRLLACVPGLTATRFFESWNPVPRFALPRGLDDRAWRGRVALAATRLLNPAFAQIHPTRWDAPDEEIGWHSIAIFGASFETQWRVPRFTAAIEAEDPTPVYREFRRMLQTVSHLRGDGGERRWVLKVPQFTQDLPAILRVFPDATVIRLRRDPRAVVASSASLVHNQMSLQSNATCARWIGQETLRKVALREHRSDAALAAADVRQVHVDYAAMTDDWAREMAQVCHALGIAFTAEVRVRMAAFLARSAKRGLDRHCYRLADYGLSGTQVEAALAVS